jgi:hypothetical protein
VSVRCVSALCRWICEGNRAREARVSVLAAGCAPSCEARSKLWVHGSDREAGVTDSVSGAVTQPVGCQVCGRQPADAVEQLGWAMDRRHGRVSWTCPGCAARNIRSLEAKLEPEWW